MINQKLKNGGNFVIIPAVCGIFVRFFWLIFWPFFLFIPVTLFFEWAHRARMFAFVMRKSAQELVFFIPFF